MWAVTLISPIQSDPSAQNCTWVEHEKSDREGHKDVERKLRKEDESEKQMR